MCDFLQKKHFKRSLGQEGFSLVEALVNVAISVIVVMGAHYAYIQANRSSTLQKNNITSKTIASQIISNGVGSGNFIPPMRSSSGSFVYVGCFDKDGIGTKNTMNTFGMIMSTKKLSEVPSGYCLPDAQYEARVFPQSSGRMSVQVWERNVQKDPNKLTVVTQREYDPPEDL